MWQKKKFDYVAIEKAHELLEQNINFHPKTELIQADQANRRILAEDIISDIDIPPFDVSHFDGYAVRAEDTRNASLRNPVRLRVVPQSHKQEYGINTGEAAPILTGNRLPSGADTVIPIERIKLKQEAIEIHYSAQPFEHTIPHGRDIKTAEKVLKSGHLLRPQDTKLLMDIRKWNVWVFEKPKVAVVSIGDELTNRIEEAEAKRFSSLELMISTLISEAGGIPVRTQIVPDNLAAIEHAVKKALEENEVVATIGGSSVGEKDYSWEAINSLNPSLKIRGIKIHPGRVTSFGLIDDKPIVMLPGHVQSTIVGFFELLLPIIRILSGLLRTYQPTIEARMTEALAVEEFASFKRVRFVKLNEVNGHYTAKPELGDSSLTSVLVKTNGYIIINENKAMVKKGEKVRVNFIPGLFLPNWQSRTDRSPRYWKA